MDNTFIDTGAQYNWTETGQVLANKPFNNETSKYFFVRADQKWNDKWSTFLRYVQADFDTAGIDDTKNWTVGVNYQYTPAVQFRLAYDQIDYGNAVANDNNGKESLIRFRTTVNF
jgi:phosphate-selective porin